MKSIKEKAEAYDKVLELATEAHKVCDGMLKEYLEHLFPELKESEDERIRKALLEMVHDTTGDELWVDYNVHKEEALAWLEKQGEQKSIVEMKSPEESLGIDSDTYNKIVDECIYGDDEQKPADKVEPKFKVGQTIKKEGFNLGFPIVKIENGFYYNDMGDNFPFTDQDNWKLVEQKPAWSEEDEKCIRLSTDIIDSALRAGFCVQLDRDRCVDWLKSLRPQNWKPSKEQMNNK